MVRTLVSRRYFFATLLVLAAVIVMARLGVWQLERRQQRLARNADIAFKLSQPPVSANDVAAGLAVAPTDREELRNLRAVAVGQFDYAHQVVLVQQVYQDTLGVRLLTPLLLEGDEKAILVDRGWAPVAEGGATDWTQYDGASGVSQVSGFFQPSQLIGRPAEPDPNQPARLEWFQADIAAIAAQLPYEVLPFYLAQSPDPQGNAAPPYRQDPEIDLSEGPHLGYAIQWFSFAVVAAIVYLRVVWQRERQARAAGDGESSVAAGAQQHV